MENDRDVDVKYYHDVFQTCHLFKEEGILEKDWILEQENISVHTNSNFKSKWLEANEVDIRD